MKKDITGVRNRILTMLPILDEYQRRIFLASEAQMLGYGGISCIKELQENKLLLFWRDYHS